MVGFLAGFDGDVEDVLFGRERAGGEVGEGAGRVVGSVEVDFVVAVFAFF